MRRFLGVSFLFALLVSVWFFPWGRGFTSSLVGIPGDVYHFVWNNHWIQQSLFHGHSPFWTDEIFFPKGAELGAHVLSFFNSIPGGLLAHLFGPVAAYNLLWAFSFILTGTLMTALGRKSGCGWFASFLGGFLFSFCYFRLGRGLGHLDHLATMFLPAVALAFLSDSRNRLAYIGRMSLVLALCAYASWYLFVCCCLLVTTLWFFLSTERGSWKWVLSALVGAFVLVLPIAIPMVQGLSSPTLMKEPGLASFSTDLWALWIPNFHPLLAGSGKVQSFFAVDPYERPAYLGWVGLLLALFAWRRAPREWKRGAFALLVIGFLLALGPTIHWNDQVLIRDPWTPYGILVRLFPPFSIFRVPSRFFVLTHFGLAWLAMFGADALKQDLQNRLSRSKVWVLLAGVFVLAGFELWASPYSRASAEVPDVYRTIGSLPGDFAVAEFPLQPGMFEPKYPGWQDRIFQYYQVYHHKKLLYGHTARVDEKWLGFLKEFQIRCLRGTVNAGWLKENRVRFAVFHLNNLRPQVFQQFWEALKPFGEEEPTSDSSVRMLRFW